MGSDRDQTVMNGNIRTCTKEDIPVLTDVIRRSFRDVAERFSLTPENASSHASNCTTDWIQRDLDRGVVYFAIGSEGRVVGCVALERANPEVCYLERLAVLPDQRGRGFGKALVDHVLSRARALGVHRVDIGIIAGHTDLRDWYEGIGFVATANREFPHLPFPVAFMSYDLNGG